MFERRRACYSPGREHADAMTTSFHAGAVLYAKDLARVRAFYEAVVGLRLERGDGDHVVLGSPVFQLVILGIPEDIASSIELASPPRRRSGTPIKLVFGVPSISAVRTAAAVHGGRLDPPEREWEFEGRRVCDGQDPEGNVFQLRQVVG
jgi:predicted enzyme related to lactoylglutathione lyase